MRDTAPNSALVEKDQFIFEQLKQGRYDAIGEAYHRYRAEFLNWAKQQSGLSEADALDLYQDALVILFKNLSSGKLQIMQSTLSAYLIGIGKKLALKRYALKLQEIFLGQSIEADIHEIELNIFQEIEQTHREYWIQKSFQQLSDVCRQIITLFYYRGFSMDQIREQMRYNSEDVAKTAKYKCLNQLKKIIHEAQLDL